MSNEQQDQRDIQEKHLQTAAGTLSQAAVCAVYKHQAKEGTPKNITMPPSSGKHSKLPYFIEFSG